MLAQMKSLARRLPPVRQYLDRLRTLQRERDALARERGALAAQLRAVAAGHAAAAVPSSHPAIAATAGRPEPEWAALRARKRALSDAHRATAATATLIPATPPIGADRGMAWEDWVRAKVEAEPYWFQRIEVLPGLHSPGWSDPAVEKLPYYGLPEALAGMRVLDIGCAEGFFSFEAERRGAREVIGIDSFPDSVRRFNIVREARRSRATAFLMNVYDLEPTRLGTFDLVLFYGVFYHLKHPQLALERIRSICTGTLLFQTRIQEERVLRGTPWARFYPHGLMSGAEEELWDPTVFWLFNSACCLAMLEHVGFTEVAVVSDRPLPFVARARSLVVAPGEPPNQAEAPFC